MATTQGAFAANALTMDWGTQFEARYTSKSQASQRKRTKRRPAKPGPDPAQIEAALGRLRTRFAASKHRDGASFWRFIELTTGHPEIDVRTDALFVVRDETNKAYADERRARARDRKAAIRLRAREGFVWDGGAVGGNPDYHVGPLTYRGLASDRHPILKLFATKLPRGRSLTVGDDKAASGPAPHRSKILGCDSAYVEANKLARGVLRVEIDRNVAWSDVAAACVTTGVPLPNIAVGHQDADGKVRHPHLIWLLADSLPAQRQHLFASVLRGLTYALVPYGADPWRDVQSLAPQEPAQSAVDDEGSGGTAI